MITGYCASQLRQRLPGRYFNIGGFESGCFHLYGLSSMGKTTCLRTAASVWGSGADGGYVRTWRSTANGLEATLAGANDTFLPLDEVGQADGRELGQALYMTAGGVGKQRMRRDASLKPVARLARRWCCRPARRRSRPSSTRT